MGAALAILSKNKNQSHLISLPKVSWACAAPLRPHHPDTMHGGVILRGGRIKRRLVPSLLVSTTGRGMVVHAWTTSLPSWLSVVAILDQVSLLLAAKTREEDLELTCQTMMMGRYPYDDSEQRWRLRRGKYR